MSLRVLTARQSLELEQRQEIAQLTQERDELALKLSVLGDEKREVEMHAEEITRQLEHVKLDLQHLQEEYPNSHVFMCTPHPSTVHCFP